MADNMAVSIGLEIVQRIPGQIKAALSIQSFPITDKCLHYTWSSCGK